VAIALPFDGRAVAVLLPSSGRWNDGIAQSWPKMWPIRGKKSLTSLGVGRLYKISMFPHGISTTFLAEYCAEMRVKRKR
jgi:hypothetical protein